MSTSYPAALDGGTSLPSVATGVDNLNAAGQKRHDTKHDTEDAAIIAVETKVGIGSSTPVAGSLLAGTGTGTSAWLTSAVTQSLNNSINEVTTTSTSFQDSGLSVTLTTTGGNVLVVASFTGQNDTGGDTWEAKIHFGFGDSDAFLFPSTEDTRTISSLFSSLGAGTYTFTVEFKVTTAGTARIVGARNNIFAVELKR